MSEIAVGARTARFGRVLGAGDGRDRVGIPFWNGLLSAFAAAGISIVVGLVALVALIVVAVLATGRLPSTDPGHPLLAIGELISYGAAGWFAAWRLRVNGRFAFRALRGVDVRTILVGIAAIVVVRIGAAFQLVAMHQTKHVQSGFEHFNVVSKTPNVTALSIVLAVLTMVFVAPLVEEMIFRGLLFGSLAPRIGVLGAALVSAALFGAAHTDLVLLPTLAALGFISAYAYAASGNLLVSISLHALNNALGAVFLIGAGLSR
ncbi:MAG TPA: type II CAAX endopeptidase family protein [Candidatus Elarobacter sp.]|nr:type II CAAX endopeptidase family protein [Candidatus Elarobacter sp.]